MSEEKDEVIENPDPHFEPIVHLPPVQTKTLEEDEDELLKLRAKLFRYDSQSEPREWKERGTGDVKILRQILSGSCRVLMRRDKTLKVCANHRILPDLELKPSCGSDRAWVWSTPADFADEEPKAELLAIRFANAENAQKFKEVFDEAKQVAGKKLNIDEKGERSTENDAADIKEKDDAKPDKEKETTTAEESTGAEKEVVDKLNKMTVSDDAEKHKDEKTDAERKE